MNWHDVPKDDDCDRVSRTEDFGVDGETMNEFKSQGYGEFAPAFVEGAILAAGCFWGVEHLFLNLEGVLSTEIVEAGSFWLAEEYHQEYLKKNPGGYICHVLRE